MIVYDICNRESFDLIGKKFKPIIKKIVSFKSIYYDDWK